MEIFLIKALVKYNTSEHIGRINTYNNDSTEAWKKWTRLGKELNFLILCITTFILFVSMSVDKIPLHHIFCTTDICVAKLN